MLISLLPRYILLRLIEKKLLLHHIILSIQMFGKKLRVDSRFLFNDSEKYVAEFTTNLNFPHPTNLGQNSWKIKVMILKHHDGLRFQLRQSVNNSTEDTESFKTYSLDQTLKHIKNCAGNNFDLFLVLGMKIDEDGYLFKLICSWLRYKNQMLSNDQQHYSCSRIGNKFDMKRKGGSNENKIDFQTFLVQFLHEEYLQGWDMLDFGC